MRMNARTLTVPLLALLCALQLICLWRAPAVYAPAVIDVLLRPGQALTLGRDELAAPQAARAHLAIRRDGAGRWWVRNASAGKQVVLQRDGTERRMGSGAVRAGQWFRIGVARFDVHAASARAIDFTGSGHAWRYDGATLYRDGAAQPRCPGAGVAAAAVALWNRAMPHALTAARPLSFGGNLNCGNRLAIAYLGGASALAQVGDGQDALLLSNAAGSEALAPLLLSSAQGERALAQREEALDGVSALIAGRTRFLTSIDGARLQLRPQSHVALSTEAVASLPAGVSWEWRRRATWALPAGAAWQVMAALCAVLAAAGALAWQGGRWPFGRGTSTEVRAGAAASALLAIAGVGALLLQRSGAGLGVGVSMLLGWAALWTFLLAAGRPALATCAGVLLLAAGLLMQLELGLGAMESSWLRHVQKSTTLLAIGLGVGTHLRLRMLAQRPIAPQARTEWALALLAGAALLALGMQVLFGDETGVFDLQPVEFAKLALTALAAHCLAIGLGWHHAMAQHEAPSRRWLRVGAPALLLAALFGLALLQVDDFSPMILLLVWAVLMALAWSAAARHAGVAALMAGLACIAIGAIAWLRLAGGEQIAQWGFYADRFAVWLDPARHPHTGQQLLLAARAIADGAWWGQGRWLGLGTLGDAAGSALLIPAVQDDFAPSFFIHRHGLLGALALWALQSLFLVGVLQTAARAFAASELARDFRQAWLWRFRCFVLCGGAAFVLGHLLLSWGTNLAIFPIMGQPMSFLSAGGSHLLFFICPLLVFNAISAQSFEEKQSCRSMSNTKSWARFPMFSMPRRSGRRPDWRCSRAARFCATCWNALRASTVAARRRAVFRT
jgi:cell division protein FtsW